MNLHSTLRLIVGLGLVLQLAVAQAQEVVPGEILVKMRGHASGSKSAAFVGKMQSRMALKTTFGKLNIHHMVITSGEDTAKVMNDLRANPDVEFVEPNYVVKITDDQAGADNHIYSAAEMQAFVAQNFAQGSYSQSSADTKVTQAWSAMSSTVSDDPVVAIVDTGIDYTHSVFTSTGAIWTNPGESGTDSGGNNRATNGVDDDGNGFVDDVRGWNFHSNTNNPMDDEHHGTHVAGIVLGVTQDIFAGTLAAAKIRLMPLKFLGSDGSGSTSDAIRAINYAVDNGAQVINNSWGGGSYSQALHEAMAYAYSHNVVIVVAAGNNSSNNDSVPMYPANYPVPSLISVAASTDFDALASFSNYGASTVPMAAPGLGIRSTIPGNAYQYMSGTSMAAPFVAGAAALAWREAPQLSGYQIRNLIVNSALSVSGLSSKVTSGARADALETVVSAKGEVSTMASQPGYTPVAPAGYRDPASDAAAKGGCGLVSTSLMKRGFKGGDGKGSSPSPLTIALTLLPLLVWQVVRSRMMADGKNRRRFDRFVMNSEIKIKIGDRELVGQMNTISLGGASFKADAMLERGGVVTLQIASPDGGEQVQVQGQIVWNEQNQSYGVQFAGARDNVLNSIRGWSKDLVKAS